MVQSNPWYANIVNYLVTGLILDGWNKHDRDRFLHLVKFYIWDDPYSFKHYSDKIVRRSVSSYEVKSSISFCHDQAYGGHFSGKRRWPRFSRFFSADFFSLCCLKMPMSTVRDALDVNS